MYHYVSLCIISRLITFPTRSRSPHCSPHSAAGHLGGAQHSLAAQKVRQISEGHGGLQLYPDTVCEGLFFYMQIAQCQVCFLRKSSHAPRPACLGLLGPFTVSLTANSETKSQHVTDTFLDPVSRWRRWNICSRISWCRSNMVQLCVLSKCSVKSVATYCKIADPVSIDWFGGAQIQTYSGKSGIYGL